MSNKKKSHIDWLLERTKQNIIWDERFEKHLNDARRMYIEELKEVGGNNE